MGSKGALSVLPMRRLRVVAGLAVLWLVFVLALGSWWVYNMFGQSRRIAELELATGASQTRVLAESEVTRRMLVWESSTFLLVLLILSGILFWFYWRDYQRARATQAFFAAVTHELRTPLTSVRLQAEAIADIAASEPGGRSAELAARLLSDSHRLESQIDKTLELARIEGGGSLAEQAIPASTWLERTLRAVAAPYGERVQLAARLPDDLPALLGDAAAVQMILRNLVENSVRHSQVTPVHVEVEAHAAGAHIEVLYRDDGRGSGEPPAKLGRLFQRGSQSSGAGVGLYLVRMLMQRMGGAVRFESPEGGGFLVRLMFQASAE